MDNYNFDASKYFLGSLCKRGHDWEGTGQSLRRNRCKTCVECRNLRTREIRRENIGLHLEKERKKRQSEAYKKSQAQYALRNKQRLQAYRAKYYSENSERIKAYNSRRFQEKKEEICQRNKEYRVKNREKCNAYYREYYARNRERLTKYKAGYRASNKDRIKY